MIIYKICFIKQDFELYYLFVLCFYNPPIERKAAVRSLINVLLDRAETEADMWNKGVLKGRKYFVSLIGPGDPIRNSRY